MYAKVVISFIFFFYVVFILLKFSLKFKYSEYFLTKFTNMLRLNVWKKHQVKKNTGIIFSYCSFYEKQADRNHRAHCFEDFFFWMLLNATKISTKKITFSSLLTIWHLSNLGNLYTNFKMRKIRSKYSKVSVNLRKIYPR